MIPTSNVFCRLSKSTLGKNSLSKSKIVCEKPTQVKLIVV